METKPGIYTTEFWTSLFVNLFMLGDLVNLWSVVPDKWAAIAMSIVTGAYGASRGIAKQGVERTAPPKLFG